MRTSRAPAPSTIRNWYTQFIEYGGFKQSMQGIRDQKAFFEEYGYEQRIHF